MSERRRQLRGLMAENLDYLFIGQWPFYFSSLSASQVHLISKVSILSASQVYLMSKMSKISSRSASQDGLISKISKISNLSASQFRLHLKSQTSQFVCISNLKHRNPSASQTSQSASQTSQSASQPISTMQLHDLSFLIAPASTFRSRHHFTRSYCRMTDPSGGYVRHGEHSC